MVNGNNEEIRVIPGYSGYAVTDYGRVYSIERQIALKQYPLDGYLIVDAFRGANTQTLPVHRAVALAWVENPEPDRYRIVNHKDGTRTNNRADNLEWTDYSGNNYHAVDTGLRSDNIRCKVRDYQTGEVTAFSSMAQAKDYMGLPRDTGIHSLYPKMYGALVEDRYEFRFEEDTKPWFYEGRTGPPISSRYMVCVTDQSGQTKEVYSNRMFLKEYGLYASPYGKSIPGLAKYGAELYPNLTFVVKDSYVEERFRRRRAGQASKAKAIRATTRDGQHRSFSSLTKCSEYFNVDRSVILSRLDTGKDYDGWTFTTATPVREGRSNLLELLGSP